MGEDTKNLDALFCCPECKKALASSGASIRCSGCAREYPRAGDVWDFRRVFFDGERHWDAEAFDLAYSSADSGYEDGMEHALRAGIPRYAEEYRQEKKERLLKDFVKEKQPGRLLDLGCGCGWFSFELAELSPETVFFGIDVSTFRVNVFKREIAARGMGGRMDAAAANGETLPFPDGAFDVVVLREVLEHLQAPGETLREVRRVLSPDGFLIVSTPTKLMTEFWRVAAILPTCAKRLMRRESLSRKAVAPVYDEPLKRSLFECLAREAGFELACWRRVVFLPHESYLQFIPGPLLRLMILFARVFEHLPFCGFLGLHHVVFLRRR